MLKKITVTPTEGSQRIENYLLKRFKSMSRAQVFKLLRTKEIKVNQTKVGVGFKVAPGDVIEVWLPRRFEQTPAAPGPVRPMRWQNVLKIVYEDDNILIIDKPAGIACQPVANSYKPSVQELLLNYLMDAKKWDQAQSFTPGICNRLDTNTTGLVLAAKNNPAAQEMHEIFKNRHIRKLYRCLVFGFLKQKQKTATAYLLKNDDANSVQVYPDRADANHLTIITKYRVIEEFRRLNMTLVEVELVTGRTHQIRSHFKYMNHPVVGDHKYGLSEYDALNRGYRYQALHAFMVTFRDLDANAFPTLSYLSNQSFASRQKPWFLSIIGAN